MNNGGGGGDGGGGDRLPNLGGSGAGTGVVTTHSEMLAPEQGTPPEHPHDMFVCKLTDMVYRDPVMTWNGYTYSRSYISTLMNDGPGSLVWRCPHTSAMSAEFKLIPNRAISSWCCDYWILADAAAATAAAAAMNTVLAMQEKISELDIKWGGGDSTGIGSAADMRSSGRSNAPPTNFGAALLPTKRMKVSPARRLPTPSTPDPVAMAGPAFGSAVGVITPFVWRGHPVGSVALSENGAVATQTDESYTFLRGSCYPEETKMVLWSLTSGNVELNKGKHYWEVVLEYPGIRAVHIGVSRPGLNPRGGDGDIHKPYAGNEVSWLVCSHTGSLYDNGERGVDAESRLIYDEGGAAVGGSTSDVIDVSADVVTGGGYVQGDRVGMLLDLNDGSLCFFRNGEEHGEGYPAGTVTGPVVAAVRMSSCGSSVRLLPRKDSNEEGSWVEVRSVVGDWNQEQ